jgi:hypothetical protein
MRWRFLIFIPLAFLSGWLMWHTLSYSSADHQILVSGKFWSDFGGYLPQIRSFSLGKNWPPQYPLYPGVPTRYHFLFYMFVGLLEKAGLQLDWALNLPSAAGFFFLLVMLWLTAKKIFQKETVAWLSLLFFLFNGSFSFLDFFKKYPLSSQSLNYLINLRDFPSFAPWNGSQIAAFWNLNVFTNQRHLGLSLALGLLLVYLLYTRHSRGIYFVGFISGLFIVLNQAVFGIAILFVGWFFLVDSTLRKPLLISALGGLPLIYFTFLTIPTRPPLNIHLGFLAPQPPALLGILNFWLLNFGLHLILIPIGFILAPKKVRILIPPLVVLFLIPNIFQLSVDIINNHKLFNFFLSLGVMFTAYTIVRIWDSALIGKIITPFLVFFLIFGGLIDLFPVINDTYFPVADIPANPDATYIVSHTPKDAVILNSTWFYHPASIAGRFIYNGYSYFTWSFGYDQVSREQTTVAIYSSPDKATACDLLRQANISYVELNPHHESFINPNWPLWSQVFTPAYTNPETRLKLYSVAQNCASL